MKWWQIVTLYVAAGLMFLLNDRVDTQEYRIVQLECALAQAHAEADTLDSMLQNALLVGQNEKNVRE